MPLSRSAYDHDGSGRPLLNAQAEDTLARMRTDLTHRVDFLADWLADNAADVARWIAAGDGEVLLAGIQQGLAAEVEAAIARRLRALPGHCDESDALGYLLDTYTEELPAAQPTLADAVAPVLDRYVAGGYRPDGAA